MFVINKIFFINVLQVLDKMYSKNSNTVKYYYNFKLLFSIVIYILKLSLFLWCKSEFSASLFQSSVSHDLQKSF